MASLYFKILYATVIATMKDTHIHASSCEVTTETLCVNQVNQDGFGDSHNRYAFSMEVFKGSLFVGTLNSNSSRGIELFIWGLPFATSGAQIYKGSIRNSTHSNTSSSYSWTRVVSNGNGNMHNFGVRKLITVGQYLYGVTANHVSGCEVWRTSNGTYWSVVAYAGFGDDENTSGRGLAAYNGYIYVGVENRDTGAKIWRRAITKTGDFEDGSDWEQVVADGFGDKTNWWFSDFVEYKGWLYAGTLNPKGMQLWRTMNGTNYEKIFEEENIINYDSAVMKLYVYNDRLYIGTMNLVDGASLYVNVDDDATVLKPIFVDGNGNWQNQYVWYMQKYMNRLYIGTLKIKGSFDLYSSIDPVIDELIVETSTGFGNEGQYGVRNMVVYEGKLMIGSAQAETSGCKVFQTERINISYPQ